jgi:aryl-alcohol dehydrogenase-like predicted oxidoreductase
LGHADEVVGRAIADRRDKVIVASKCGSVWDEGSTVVREVLKADSVRKEAEASLRRLGVDVIDLYQIHWPEPAEDIEAAWGVIGDLIREGKVRYGGVSNFNVDQHKRLQAMHPIASSQPAYCMLLREIEKDLLPFCYENKIGVIVYWALMAGLLSGKFTKERASSLGDDDWRQGRYYFTEPALSATLSLVEGLRRIADRNGRTVAQLSIAWVLRRPEVTGAILGARRPSQIQETIAAADWSLSDEDLAEIELLLEERKRRLPADWVDYRD